MLQAAIGRHFVARRDIFRLMERVIILSSFDQENAHNPALEYWLNRSSDERLQEVERLRREYMVAISGEDPNRVPQGLSRSLRVVERSES